MTSTHTTKWENLEPEQMVENYIRLKEMERLRNKKSYENLKLNKEKYYERLNKNYIHQVEYIEQQKTDEQKLQEFKERRKIINKRAYEKRKKLKQLELN